MPDNPKPPPLDYAPQYPPKKLRLAVSASAFGIISIPFMAIFFLGIVPAVAGIAMGAIALLQLRRLPGTPGKIDALIGIICGCIALLLGTLCAVALQHP
jgi:hypothetical protein